MAIPFQPIPKERRHCTSCQEDRARWVHTALGQPVCALCVLPAWQPSELTAVIEALEKSKGRTFPKDDAGRLTEIGDADDLLGVLILADRAGAKMRGQDE